MLLSVLGCKMSTVWNNIAHITPHLTLTAIKGDGTFSGSFLIIGMSCGKSYSGLSNLEMKVLKQKRTQTWNLR